VRYRYEDTTNWKKPVPLLSIQEIEDAVSTNLEHDHGATISILPYPGSEKKDDSSSIDDINDEFGWEGKIDGAQIEAMTHGGHLGWNPRAHDTQKYEIDYAHGGWWAGEDGQPEFIGGDDRDYASVSYEYETIKEALQKLVSIIQFIEEHGI